MNANYVKLWYYGHLSLLSLILSDSIGRKCTQEQEPQKEFASIFIALIDSIEGGLKKKLFWYNQLSRIIWGNGD